MFISVLDKGKDMDIQVSINPAQITWIGEEPDPYDRYAVALSCGTIFRVLKKDRARLLNAHSPSHQSHNQQ